MGKGLRSDSPARGSRLTHLPWTLLSGPSRLLKLSRWWICWLVNEKNREHSSWHLGFLCHQGLFDDSGLGEAQSWATSERAQVGWMGDLSTHERLMQVDCFSALLLSPSLLLIRKMKLGGNPVKNSVRFGQWVTQETLWSVSRWQSSFWNQKLKRSKMGGLVELFKE